MMLFNLHISIWHLIFWTQEIILIIGSVESIDLFNSLKLLFDYFNQNNQSQTPDAMLGIHFVKLILKSTLDECNKSETFVAARINELLDVADRVNYPRKDSEFANIYNRIVSQELLKFEFSPVRDIQYGKILTNSDPLLTYDEYLDKVDTGHPNAFESDICLAELLSSNAYCIISSTCSDIMSWKIDAYGYQLTHKLLYYTILSQSNCTPNFLPFFSTQAIITLLCSNVLRESILIYKMEFPSVMKDLLLEQVLLCGFNGFAEFLEERWIENIVKWQNFVTGCYEYHHNDHRSKRSMVIFQDNCSDHMSGIAAATITLFARILILDSLNTNEIVTYF